MTFNPCTPPPPHPTPTPPPQDAHRHDVEYVYVDPHVLCTPSIADIDGDGHEELVGNWSGGLGCVGSGVFWGVGVCRWDGACFGIRHWGFEHGRPRSDEGASFVHFPLQASKQPTYIQPTFTHPPRT